MNRIVHISLKVDDVQRTGNFYKEVFGFQDAETRKTRDHVSRHMNDGAIDFTLMKYDADTQSAESKAAGDGPCIHHFAIEVDDLEHATREIHARGCKVVSNPGVIPVKFRAPGGTRGRARAQRPLQDAAADGKKIDKIVHPVAQVRRRRRHRRFLPAGLRLPRLRTKKTRDHCRAHGPTARSTSRS
jgi:lactoylglutathione lyase